MNFASLQSLLRLDLDVTRLDFAKQILDKLTNSKKLQALRIELHSVKVKQLAAFAELAVKHGRSEWVEIKTDLLKGKIKVKQLEEFQSDQLAILRNSFKLAFH
jgi:hypothetical protein